MGSSGNIDAQVAAAVTSLPADQRRALALAASPGRTVKDVARSLGVPESTAKSLLRTALSDLRAELVPPPAEVRNRPRARTSC